MQMLSSRIKVEKTQSKLLSIGLELDSDILMRDAIEIINEGMGFDFTGIFSFSKNMQTAFLRAGSGKKGGFMVDDGHKLQLNKSSLFAPVAQNEIRIFDGWSGKTYGCFVPTIVDFETILSIRLLSENTVMHSKNAPAFVSAKLPDPFWEIALPLRPKNRVIGSLWIQVFEFSSFTVDDCLSLQWLADQLSAILFKNSE
jgi:hypothetical protein